MWREENGSNHPIRNSRLVGDRFTWTIPFDTKHVTWSRTPDYILEYADFAIDVDRTHNFGNSEVGYNSVQTTNFRLKRAQECIPNGILHCREWMDALSGRKGRQPDYLRAL